MFRLRMQEFASFKIISSGLRVRSIALTPYPHLKIVKFARIPNDQGKLQRNLGLQYHIFCSC